MFFFFIFNIDENIIKIYNNKNIKFFYQNLINVALKSNQYIDLYKKHYLILKVAITGPKYRLLFIAFSDLPLIISISLIKRDKILRFI